MKGLTPLQRFENFVSPEPNSGCWLWDSAYVDHRYGVMWLDGRNQYAHRVSYMLHKGEIPQSSYVCHKCDNPACVNPDHLFLGDARENALDCVRKGRRHGQTLTVNQVAEIKKRLLGGESRTVLAREFSTTLKVIEGIAQGAKWKHVEAAA